MVLPTIDRVLPYLSSVKTVSHRYACCQIRSRQFFHGGSFFPGDFRLDQVDNKDEDKTHSSQPTTAAIPAKDPQMSALFQAMGKALYINSFSSHGHTKKRIPRSSFSRVHMGTLRPQLELETILKSVFLP